MNQLSFLFDKSAEHATLDSCGSGSVRKDDDQREETSCCLRFGAPASFQRTPQMRALLAGICTLHVRCRRCDDMLSHLGRLRRV